VKPWHFNTESLPHRERHRAWTKALHRLCLPAGEFADNDDFRGAISCIVSPLGIEFARIDSSAHEISGAYPNQPSSIWLALLLDGVADFFDGEQLHRMAAGDMAFGQSGVAAKLKFKTDSSQLFIKIPEIALSQRMISPLSLDVGFLPGRSGISRVLSGMLNSLAAGLDSISNPELRPVELALTELFITCLASAGKLSRGHATGNHTDAVRTAHLHRICQTIEAGLGDASLKPKQIADEHGISLRYLQKLFALTGQTFSGYVRSRRLERCRIDLASPLYAHLSITEICYRWGFNASAHFSRAFREQFNQSPRDYRRDPTRHAGTVDDQ
jgi:AraC-like DNA-binding protein